MANEITVGISVSVANGTLRKQLGTQRSTYSVDQAAAGGPTPGYVTIGTTVESIAFSELSTLGVIMLTNLDPTNYVRWGFTSGTYGGRIKPTESWAFRLEPGTTLYMIANTAACKCLVEALEA